MLRYRGYLYRLALPYADEGFVGQRWGRQGSGLLLTTGDRVLLLHRSPYVEEPGTWGIPGGAVPVDTITHAPKDSKQSALHEAEEEMGSVPRHRIMDQYVYSEASGFHYTTFIGLVDQTAADAWKPKFNWENDDYGWFTRQELNSLPLHFGVEALLQAGKGFLPRQKQANITFFHYRGALYRRLADNISDYRGTHRAPTNDGYHAPLWRLTNIYPDDIYSSKGLQYYGDGTACDPTSISIIQAARNRPNRPVKIYRAVPHVPTNAELLARYEKEQAYILRTGKLPSGVDGFRDSNAYYGWLTNELARLRAEPTSSPAAKLQINRGDWVTICRAYAVLHGHHTLSGQFRVVSKQAFARDLWTDGNSIHEWGYDPQPAVVQERLQNQRI